MTKKNAVTNCTVINVFFRLLLPRDVAKEPLSAIAGLKEVE